MTESFKHLLLIAILVFGGSPALFSQTNTWVKATDNEVGTRLNGAMVYSAVTDEYLVSMGYLRGDQGKPVYSEQSFQFGVGHWANHLPAPSLYGIWADKFGAAYSNGLTSAVSTGNPYFHFGRVAGGGTSYLRP